MDVGLMNDIGITAAGVAGIALFYWIGRRNDARRREERSRDAGRGGKEDGGQSCPASSGRVEKRDGVR